MRPVARKWGYLCAVTLSVGVFPVMTLAQTQASWGTASTPSDKPAASSSAAVADIPFVSPDAANFQVASAPDAWGGPRGDHPVTLSDRVVRYTIQATLDPVKHTVDGKQTLTWRNRSEQPICSDLPAHVPQRLRGPRQHLHDRAAQHGSGFRSNVDSLKDGDWGYIELNKVAARWRRR